MRACRPFQCLAIKQLTLADIEYTYLQKDQPEKRNTHRGACGGKPETAITGHVKAKAVSRNHLFSVGYLHHFRRGHSARVQGTPFFIGESLNVPILSRANDMVISFIPPFPIFKKFLWGKGSLLRTSAFKRTEPLPFYTSCTFMKVAGAN